jgi:hypothetical protein
MHPFHALSNIVLQSLYMYEWSYKRILERMVVVDKSVIENPPADPTLCNNT